MCVLAFIGALAIVAAAALAGYLRIDCQGAPAASGARFAEGLKLSRPDLRETAPRAEVIKNGIRRTGMPNIGVIEVLDAETWSMVAFMKALPSVTDEQLKAWRAPGRSKASGTL